MARMDVQKAYSEWAATYDRDENLTRDLDEFVTRETLSGLLFDSILELGSGTGKNTILLSRVGKKVLGLDFSAEMINKARSKLQADNVQFVLADLTMRWPIDQVTFDLVVCNLVLEHIEDIRTVFGSIAHFIKNNGIFFVCELHPIKQYQGKAARFNSDSGPVEVPAYVHHISDFLEAAAKCGLQLESLKEWWHEADAGKPPRLVSFVFRKA